MLKQGARCTTISFLDDNVSGTQTYGPTIHNSGTYLQMFIAKSQNKLTGKGIQKWQAKGKIQTQAEVEIQGINKQISTLGNNARRLYTGEADNLALG